MKKAMKFKFWAVLGSVLVTNSVTAQQRQETFCLTLSSKLAADPVIVNEKAFLIGEGVAPTDYSTTNQSSLEQLTFFHTFDLNNKSVWVPKYKLIGNPKAIKTDGKLIYILTEITKKRTPSSPNEVEASLISVFKATDQVELISSWKMNAEVKDFALFNGAVFITTFSQSNGKDAELFIYDSKLSRQLGHYGEIKIRERESSQKGTQVGLDFGEFFKSGQLLYIPHQIRNGMGVEFLQFTPGSVTPNRKVWLPTSVPLSGPYVVSGNEVVSLQLNDLTHPALSVQSVQNGNTLNTYSFNEQRVEEQKFDYSLFYLNQASAKILLIEEQSVGDEFLSRLSALNLRMLRGEHLSQSGITWKYALSGKVNLPTIAEGKIAFTQENELIVLNAESGKELNSVSSPWANYYFAYSSALSQGRAYVGLIEKRGGGSRFCSVDLSPPRQMLPEPLSSFARVKKIRPKE